MFAVLLLLLAGIGHLVVWMALVNRLHALALPVRAIACLTLLMWSLMVAIPYLLAPACLAWRDGRGEGTGLLWLYLLPCAGVALFTAGSRLNRFLRRPDRHPALASLKTDVVRLSPSMASGSRLRPLIRQPWNQALTVHIHQKRIALPRLPASLHGIRVAHLSDFHMTGSLDQSFFVEAVERTNSLRPDLVAITGDLFDAEACLSWIPATYAQLESRWGVFFVLGNHDLKVDYQEARRRLVAAGLLDLGGRLHEICVDSATIQLGGNELPWHGPTVQFPPGRNRSLLRVLLSHTPDQIRWAKASDVDLMLCGHTHGGQIRVPWLGPIVAPSLWGTEYTAGTFYEEPTVMHVSRGLSSALPLRVYCPPEISLLELVGGQAEQNVSTPKVEVRAQQPSQATVDAPAQAN